RRPDRQRVRAPPVDSITLIRLSPRPMQRPLLAFQLEKSILCFDWRHTMRPHVSLLVALTIAVAACSKSGSSTPGSSGSASSSGAGSSGSGTATSGTSGGTTGNASDGGPASRDAGTFLLFDA